MRHRATLLNTEILTSDPRALELARLTLGAPYVEIGEADGRIPVPWLACFRTPDLRPVELPTLWLPCTSVAAARENLSAGFSFYRAIVGDAVVAEAYWRHATDGLADLPLPFLALQPLEVLRLDDGPQRAKLLADSLSGTTAAIVPMKRLSGFDDAHAPYPFDTYHQGPRGALGPPGRLDSSAALDPGYLRPERRRWHRPEASPAAGPAPSRKPWWKRW